MKLWHKVIVCNGQQSVIEESLVAMKYRRQFKWLSLRSVSLQQGNICKEKRHHFVPLPFCLFVTSKSYLSWVLGGVPKR